MRGIETVSMLTPLVINPCSQEVEAMIDIVNDTPDIIEVHVQDPPSGTSVCLELNTFLQLQSGQSLSVTTVDGKSYAVLVRKPGITNSGTLVYDLSATATIKVKCFSYYDGDSLVCTS